MKRIKRFRMNISGLSCRYIYYRVCTSRMYYYLLLSMSDSLLSEQTTSDSRRRDAKDLARLQL